MDVDRSPTTIDLYLINFKAHIIPRWGQYLLEEIKAPEIEKWLRSLLKAPGTKSKLRNQMSALYSHAIRHGIWEKSNPIAAVRQSAKRQVIPNLLSLDEMRSILDKLADRPLLQTALLVAAATGLRRSKINGLKWEDIDWQARCLHPKRGWVQGKITKMKTEASRRGVPVLEDLLEALQKWRSKSPNSNDTDWVFASEQRGGRNPIWFGVALQNHIRPAARLAGVHKRIGWHTFRHSLAFLLAAKGENVKVVQELLRHANSSITLQLYQQADADQKRAAQQHTRALFMVSQKTLTATHKPS